MSSTRKRRSAVKPLSATDSHVLNRLVTSTTGISAVLGHARLAIIGLKLGTVVLRNTARIARRHPLGMGLMALGLLWAYDHNRQRNLPSPIATRSTRKPAAH